MKHKIILLFAAVLAVLSACEEQDWTYQGEQFFEYSPYENGQSFSGGLFSKENAIVGDDAICVQLIAHSTAPVTVKYRIAEQVFYLRNESAYATSVPAGTDPATVDTLRTEAIYGEQYEILSSGFDPNSMTGSIVIPAGEYFGRINLNMKVKAGASFYMVLEDSPDCRANKPTSILRYTLAPDKVFYFEESFLQSIPSTWQILDKDGDGYCWEFYKRGACSDSYLSAAGALSPENYLISPKISIGNRRQVMLEFTLETGSKSYSEEGYRVIASESPITLDNCRDADIVQDWKILDSSYYDGVTDQVDLSAYAGKDIYIGIVHGNCTDQKFIWLYNLVIYGM